MRVRVGVVLVGLAVVASMLPATAALPSGGPDGAPMQDLLTRHGARRQAAGPDVRPTAADSPDVIPGRFLVTYHQTADLERRSRDSWRSLMTAGVTDVQPIAERVALVTVDPSQTARLFAGLAADPAVVAVEPDIRREFSVVPNDTSYDLQWAHRQTNAPAAWERFTGAGPGQTPPLIAILDSGVDATHPDLDDVVVASWRSAGGQVIEGAPQNDPCGIGHGTMVAGAAAAEGNNAFGVSGVLWRAQVIDIALTSPENGCPGGPPDSDTIAAMDFLTRIDPKPQVINLSLGSSAPSCSTAWQAAADQARAADILVVAAAGNDGTSQTSVPASCDGVVSIGATAADRDRADYSQTNPQLDLAAPGGDLPTPIEECPTYAELAGLGVLTTSLFDPSTVIGSCPPYSDPNGHRLESTIGTSFAAPYAAAAAAMIRQLAADQGSPLSPDQTEAILEASSQDAGPSGRDCEFGWGIVDLAAAVQMVLDGTRPALQPDPPIGSGSCGDGPTPTDPPTDPGDTVTRVAAGNGEVTDRVTQAVAVSSALPPASAPFGVLARVDDFADALTGSAVGLGLAPLLFTHNDGPLDDRTLQEFLRVLDFDGRTPSVFIMGGTAAIPGEVDGQLAAAGIQPVRIAGVGREETAELAAQTVEELTADVNFPTRDYAFVAFGRDWPDAVAVGQIAAYYGIPILLTNTEQLHPITRAELQRLAPERVYVLGGTAVVSDTVMQQIGALGLAVDRVWGPTRVETALEIARLYVSELLADGGGAGIDPPPVAAVNLDNNFNDVLSASLIGGNGFLFFPLRGADGSVVTQTTRDAFCGLGSAVLLVGGRDVVSDQAAQTVAGVIDGTAC